MIRCVCMICGIQYNTKEADLPGDMISHGLCERDYQEAMANINSQIAELQGDRAHGGEHEQAV